MRKWVTEIQAIDPHTGQLKTWMGDYVEAPTWELAQQWCDQNKGYLKVTGELIAEIPCQKGSCEPDFNSMIDYQSSQLN